VREALGAHADWIMLDNMKPEEIRAAVREIAGAAFVEATGGITLANVSEFASTGVDAISVGALTHSPRAIDLAIDVRPE
jgi:nicotinate-nucleotide pyrophosphorylase (carboxylating)